MSTIIDEIFGNHEKTTSSEDDLNIEKSGSAEKKPKAEISKDETIVFTERERFWEGMK